MLPVFFPEDPRVLCWKNGMVELFHLLCEDVATSGVKRVKQLFNCIVF